MSALPCSDTVHPVRARSLDWRRRRGYRNACRLGRQVSSLAETFGAVCLGPDDFVGSLYCRSGLGDDAVAAVRFDASGRTSTIVVPTLRTWHRPHLRALANRLASVSYAYGRIVLVVPPAEVRRQPRLDNAERIVGSMRPPAAGDLATLARCAAARGDVADLATCAAALPGPHALERIFGLMAGGHLSIDLDAALGPRSIVRLRASCWSTPWEVLGWQPPSPDRSI
ncbi:hypothetical protein [Methylobacterium oxalidis]|uniref:hypothetical protein n=1 Tax=Methylobacterium oxalidis TaxID=944322 RepID=UPI00331603D6